MMGNTQDGTTLRQEISGICQDIQMCSGGNPRDWSFRPDRVMSQKLFRVGKDILQIFQKEYGQTLPLRITFVRNSCLIHAKSC